MTIREMAADMQVAAKTIRRDLDVFRSVGFPLDETTGEYNRKTWRIRASGQGHGHGHALPLSFRFDEALALYMGRRLLEPLAGTLFWDAAQGAFRKIRAALGEPALAYLERMSCFFHPTNVGYSDYSKKARLLDALTIAIEEARAAHLLYQSDRATEPAFRDVYPYTFLYHKGSIYLVALDPQADRLKHYKVDRIEDVEVSNFPFRRPPDFDPAAHLASTFGVYLGDGNGDGVLTTIKVRFAPAVARYVLESKWHPSQVLTPQRDGSLLAEFQLASTEEFRSWVLSFGRKAVILEPEELRREVAEEIDAMRHAYDAGGASPVGDRLRPQKSTPARFPDRRPDR
jgi:proteasome accessory factor B